MLRRGVGSLCKTEGKTFYVWVGVERRLESIEEAKSVTDDVAVALRKYEMKKALFDMRGIDSHDAEVADVMWDWADQCPDVIACAILLDDELARVRTNMVGVSREVRVKAFRSVLRAEKWLATAEIRRKTRELPRL